jgi:hypothetical protein
MKEETSMRQIIGLPRNWTLLAMDYLSSVSDAIAGFEE